MNAIRSKPTHRAPNGPAGPPKVTKTPAWRRLSVCCAETRLGVGRTSTRVSMQHAKVRAPRGVFNGVGDLVFQQPLKIALDATYSLGPNLSGVGVYSRHILNGLAFAHPEARFLHCYRPHRLLASFSDRLPPNSSRRLLWSTWPRQADLFHGLNQRIDARHRRTVSTFHDLFVLSGDYSTP